MNRPELHKKTRAELEKLLREKRERLRQLRFDLIADKLKNYRQIRHLKKEAARILTIVNQK